MKLYQEFPPDENKITKPRILIAESVNIDVLKKLAADFALKNSGLKREDNIWLFSPDHPSLAHIMKVGKEYELVIRLE